MSAITYEPVEIGGTVREVKGPDGLYRKSVPTFLTQPDEEGEGIVEAIVSVTNLEDDVHDIIEPGAYTKTLREIKPKVAWNHEWSKWCGKVLEIRELMPNDPGLPLEVKALGGGGLYVKVQFNLNTQLGREAFDNVKFFGDECAWSIGYHVKAGAARFDTKTGVRHIKELRLFEISPVLHGAMPLASTLSIKSRAALLDVEEKHGDPSRRGYRLLHPQTPRARAEHDARWVKPSAEGDDDFTAGWTHNADGTSTKILSTGTPVTVYPFKEGQKEKLRDEIKRRGGLAQWIKDDLHELGEVIAYLLLRGAASLTLRSEGQRVPFAALKAADHDHSGVGADHEWSPLESFVIEALKAALVEMGDEVDFGALEDVVFDAIEEWDTDAAGEKHGNPGDPGYRALHPSTRVPDRPGKPRGALARDLARRRGAPKLRRDPTPGAGRGAAPEAARGRSERRQRAVDRDRAADAAGEARSRATLGRTAVVGTKPKIPNIKPGDEGGKVYKVDTVEEAVEHLAKDRKVELRHVSQVSTLLDRLNAITKDAKAKGEKAPNYDLCKVTVEGTNLFCVDEETEILTAQGWRRYDEIAVGDEVLTLNHKTGLSEWEPLLRVNQFPAEPRLMVAFESASHSSLTTFDHRWAVIAQDGRRKWTTSAEIGWGDRVPVAAPCANLPSEAKYDDALVELVAWTWTEGTVDRGGSVRIYQSDRKNPSHCQAIRASLVSLFGPERTNVGAGGRLGVSVEAVPGWYSTIQDTTKMVSFHLNKAASDIVLAHMDERKVVFPSFVRALTRSQLELFVERSLDADGHRGATTDSFSQRVEERNRVLEMACALMGRKTSTGSSPERREGRNQDLRQYTTTISRKRQVVRPVAIAKSAGIAARQSVVVHDGIVWCPTTPNGTWFARRRGTVYYTGNCVESKGIPRIKMPQLKADNPLPGSKASKLKPDKRGEYSVEAQFRQHLVDKGVKVTEGRMLASHMKASQNELNGSKVAGIAGALESGVVMDGKLFVSNDDYIVDGHHRWAATVGLDTADDKLGDLEMDVDQIDMSIIELLAEANQFARDWGIPQADVAKADPNPDKKSLEQKHGDKGDPDYRALHPERKPKGPKLTPPSSSRRGPRAPDELSADQQAGLARQSRRQLVEARRRASEARSTPRPRDSGPFSEMLLESGMAPEEVRTRMTEFIERLRDELTWLIGPDNLARFNEESEAAIEQAIQRAAGAKSLDDDEVKAIAFEAFASFQDRAHFKSHQAEQPCTTCGGKGEFSVEDAIIAPANIKAVLDLAYDDESDLSDDEVDALAASLSEDDLNELTVLAAEKGFRLGCNFCGATFEEDCLASCVSNEPEFKAEGGTTTPSDRFRARHLIRWYERGGGAARIRWGTKGDFMRCVRLAARHMSPENAKGFCNLRHQGATGHPPGQGPHAGEHGKKGADYDEGKASQCPHCDYKGAPDDKGHCVKCGKPMLEEKADLACTNCGYEGVPGQDGDCPKCGKPMMEAKHGDKGDPGYEALHPNTQGVDADVPKPRRQGFPKAGPEAQRRLQERLKEDRERNGRDIVQRLIEAYLNEPDRQYAEEFWGEILRERGITPPKPKGVKGAEGDEAKGVAPEDAHVVLEIKTTTPGWRLSVKDHEGNVHALAHRPDGGPHGVGEIQHAPNISATDMEGKRHFSDYEREEAAEDGEALPDGSFPIKNLSDLRNAISAYGRAKDKERARRHIIRRARALNATNLLPDSWGVKSIENPEDEDEATRAAGGPSATAPPTGLDGDDVEAGRASPAEAPNADVGETNADEGETNADEGETKIAKPAIEDDDTAPEEVTVEATSPESKLINLSLRVATPGVKVRIVDASGGEYELPVGARSGDDVGDDANEMKALVSDAYALLDADADAPWEAKVATSMLAQFCESKDRSTVSAANQAKMRFALQSLTDVLSNRTTAETAGYIELAEVKAQVSPSTRDAQADAVSLEEADLMAMEMLSLGLIPHP